LQVNDLATFYLSFLMIPHLAKAEKPGRLVIVASGVHYYTELDKEVLSAPSVYEKLSEEQYFAYACFLWDY
jgi:hypothetical protein